MINYYNRKTVVPQSIEVIEHIFVLVYIMMYLILQKCVNI